MEPSSHQLCHAHGPLFEITLLKKRSLSSFHVLSVFAALSIRISSERSSLADSSTVLPPAVWNREWALWDAPSCSHGSVRGFRISLYKWELQWPGSPYKRPLLSGQLSCTPLLFWTRLLCALIRNRSQEYKCLPSSTLSCSGLKILESKN